MNPEPRTQSHHGADGNQDEDSGDENSHRDRQPFGEKMRERPISEKCSNECNPWEEQTQHEKPDW